MKPAIQARARELGFDLCRFTSADPLPSSERFNRWLDAQFHGAMAYLQRNASKRTDPRQILDRAQTIITLGASYSLSANATSSNSSPTRGIIARYARFQDYHRVLGERLKQLAEFVRELGGPDCESLWYTDTGPFLERDLAQRSGLGFIGKHTNLINRQFGNWLFLAEIITTIPMKPDPPERNYCGACSRCLSACPTRAIVAPFQLDARKCISYLTIELKGSIPIEWRAAIGSRIFGCDDCLEACPWNRFAREGSIMRNYHRPELEAPDLVELLSIDESDFRRRFGDTPIARTKRRGLVRNVCVALGNTGSSEAVPALGKAAQEPDPLIAEHAQWAIRAIEERQSQQNQG